MSRQQVLLSGYFGFDNAGDEAILESTVGLLRERKPELPICALSRTPGETAARLAIGATARMSPGGVAAQLLRSRLLISGGGSLLQDVTSHRSLAYYLTLLSVGRAFGCRTFVMAQGIGPLRAARSRKWVASVLNRVDALTVRDVDSARLLREIGVRREAEVTADLAFALPPRYTPRVAARTGSSGAIAVSLRPWPGVEALLGPLAACLREARGAGGGGGRSLLGWPLNPAEDLPILRKLADLLPELEILEGPYTPGEWVALAGGCSVVLGMRLHALIFGACGSAAVMGISYDPKVESLLDRVHGVRVGVAGEGLDEALLRRELRRRLDEPPERRGMRADRLAHLRALAARNADVACELLDG